MLGKELGGLSLQELQDMEHKLSEGAMSVKNEKVFIFIYFKLFFIIFLKKIIGYKTRLISTFLLISGEKAVGEAGKIETSGKNLNNNLREIFLKKIKDLKIAENGVGKAFIASLIFFF